MSRTTLSRTASDTQYADLTKEILSAIDTRFTALEERLQRKFSGAADEIARMQDSAAARDESRDAVMRTMIGQERAGTLKHSFADNRQAAAFGRACKALMRPAGFDLSDEDRRAIAAITDGSGASGGYVLGESVVGPILSNLEGANGSVFERNCPFVPVMANTGIPRITQGATVYYPDYGTAPGDSSMRLGSTKLRLTNYAVFALADRWMYQAASDIAFGEFIANEFRRALAIAIDSNAFIGDGSPTYARVTGIFNRAASGNVIVTADSGDNTYAECIDATTKYLAQMAGGVPEVTLAYQPKWFGSSSVWFRYLGARDGSNRPIADMFAAGQKQLWGYDFETVSVAPKLSDASQASKAFLAFGALRRAWAAARFVSGIEIRVSDQYKFAEGQIAILLNAVQDMDEADPGAIALLKTAAS